MMFRQLMFLLFCGLGIACMPAVTQAAAPVEGKDYSVLKAPVADAPAVVEFFSFYCPPCAAFSSRFQVSQAVDKILPSGDNGTDGSGADGSLVGGKSTGCGRQSGVTPVCGGTDKP